MKVCLDTSVFIAVKNVETDSQQCERILDAIDDKRIEGVTSSLVIAETLMGFYQNNEDREAEHFLTHAAQNYMVSPVDLEVAEKAARIRAEQRIRLPDAIIIATAEVLNTNCLVTKDDTLRKRATIESLTPREFVNKYLG